MRKLAALVAVLVCLVAAQSAAAAIPNVFGSIACTSVASGPQAGQRQCGSATGTVTPSWDGTPIDVSVTFPPATGADNNYPVIGIFHGWGGSKITPANSATQRWVAQGYGSAASSSR